MSRWCFGDVLVMYWWCFSYVLVMVYLVYYVVWWFSFLFFSNSCFPCYLLYTAFYADSHGNIHFCNLLYRLFDFTSFRSCCVPLFSCFGIFHMLGSAGGAEPFKYRRCWGLWKRENKHGNHKSRETNYAHFRRAPFEIRQGLKMLLWSYLIWYSICPTPRPKDTGRLEYDVSKQRCQQESIGSVLRMWKRTGTISTPKPTRIYANIRKTAVDGSGGPEGSWEHQGGFGDRGECQYRKTNSFNQHTMKRKNSQTFWQRQR